MRATETQPLLSAASPVDLKTPAHAQTSNPYLYRNLPGRHLATSPVVGSRFNEVERMFAAVTKYPVLGKLNAALYQQTNIYIIPAEKRLAAAEIAKTIFLKYIEKYKAAGFTDQNIVNWNRGYTYPSNITSTFNTDKPEEWYIVPTVEVDHAGHDPVFQKFNEREIYDLETQTFARNFLPPYVTAYHELMHVEESSPGTACKDLAGESFEIFTTLKTLILVDEIYKDVMKTPKGVAPSKDEMTIDGKKFKISEFINFYRDLENKYGGLCNALLSRESLVYLGHAFVNDEKANPQRSPLRQNSAIQAVAVPAMKPKDDDCVDCSCLSGLFGRRAK